jgi:hypothetical protein
MASACRTKGLSEISPQQSVAGAPAGTVSQDLYVAYAAADCARGVGANLPDANNCATPEISAEVAGFGFKFQANNENFSGKKKARCTATCGANPPTLECTEVEDGNL